MSRTNLKYDDAQCRAMIKNASANGFCCGGQGGALLEALEERLAQEPAKPLRERAMDVVDLHAVDVRKSVYEAIDFVIAELSQPQELAPLTEHQISQIGIFIDSIRKDSYRAIATKLDDTFESIRFIDSIRKDSYRAIATKLDETFESIRPERLKRGNTR